jgi:hypothetical protein
VKAVKHKDCSRRVVSTTLSMFPGRALIILVRLHSTTDALTYFQNS